MIRTIEEDVGLKHISMAQIETAFSMALASLVAGDSKVAIRSAKDVSDGADNLIGQERWELTFSVVVSKGVLT